MIMRYKEMIDDAKAKGLTSEKVMWASVDDMDNLLCVMKKEHPKEYWEFMRKQHGIMFHNHYDAAFAEYAVSER